MEHPEMAPRLDELLARVVESTTFLNPNSSGGAHTDVFRINGEALARNLESLVPEEVRTKARPQIELAAAKVAERFILKRGKTRDFAMQIVGSRENVIPRKAVSQVFGPHGYNLLPTVEKLLTDASEAAREIPYFAYGSRGACLAPDVLSQLHTLVTTGEIPDGFLQPDKDLFLSFLPDAAEPALDMTVYEVLTRDLYFKGRTRDFDGLSQFQQFVRSNPLTREMEEMLSQFFDAPITVGLRDVVRWARGSRHPEIGWEKASQVIKSAFETHGDETFLPVEMTYYGIDSSVNPMERQSLLEINERVVPLFAALLKPNLKKQRLKIADDVVLDLAREILDFHHGYPLYDIEPYQGVLSVSTLRLGLRLGLALAMLSVGFELPEKPNFDLAYLRRRPGAMARLGRDLDESQTTRLIEAISQTLLVYHEAGGVRDDYGNLWSFHRIPRTFYAFQENALYRTSQKGTVEEVFTLEELANPEHRDLLRTIPELARKLTVFFTMVYRYYKETGFVPDLRPRHAGRDIFVLGIWGYVSDNLLVLVWKDAQGERHADLSFVDNRDHFKEYRRSEDRRQPVGIAKNAARLTSGIIEPAMIRSIGLFANQVWENDHKNQGPHSSVVSKYLHRGLDIAQEVAHSAIDQAFDTTKSAVQDFADDIFTAIKGKTKF